MKFDSPLEKGTLIKRYKRFLADIKRADGSEITVHCPNTGSMQQCNIAGSAVWFYDSGNAKRKYPHTWEQVAVADGTAIAGINTNRANSLVVEGLETGVIKELQGYDALKTEVKYGAENSRIDVMLTFGQQACYVEVKNVTLGEGIQGWFPDAVTTRGQKHLRELMAMVAAGHRAVLLFCVQHTGVTSVAAAAHIDPDYATLLTQARDAGVEIIAYQADLTPTEATLVRALPVLFSD